MTNKVIQDDCLNALWDIPDKSVDMIFADLPYGTTNCSWDTIIPFKPLWEQLERVIKDNGAMVFTGSQPFTSALVMSNPKLFRYELIWEKSRPTGMAQAKYQIMKKHENILIFYKKIPTFNPIKEKKQYMGKDNLAKPWASHNTGNNHGLKKTEKKICAEKRNPTSVLYVPSIDPHKILHPTQKPVALLEYLIKTYTNEGDTVLDPTAGSGSTGVACKNLNRNYILIEKEERYINIIKDRLGVKM